MKDTLVALLALVTLFVLLPVLILWARDRIQALLGRETPAQREACLKAWRERLLDPNPEEVEALRGGMLPHKLLDMYADSNLVLSQDFDVCPAGRDPNVKPWRIGEFLPLRKQDQQSTWDLTEFGKACCFANNGMGDFYWVPMSPERLGDAPVYIIWHDGWNNEKVADSLSEFLSWPRTSKK
jgi:hypothetical protein